MGSVIELLVLADPIGDSEELYKLAGTVGDTTGRLVTEGGSTTDRLLEVVTNDGADGLAVVNVLGIELTRGIAAVGEVVWCEVAGAVATAATAFVATGVIASGVAVTGVGLLASKELSGGGTMASDDGVIGAEESVWVATDCGGSGIGAETRG